MSRQTEENAVSAGFALGLASLDRNSRPGDKVSFDLAFDGAWRKWPHSHLFRSVHGPSPVDPWWLVASYTFRKHTPWAPVYWDDGVVYARHETDESDPSWLEHADRIHENVPGEAWVQLAQEVFDRLDRK